MSRHELESIAKTSLSLNEAVFAWCLRHAQGCFARGALEHTLQWGLLAAKSALHHGFGWLASPELEAILLKVAGQLPVPHDNRVSMPPRSGRWLHVLDKAHVTGGHTTLVQRWIEFDRERNRHDVILLSQREPVPPSLIQVVRDAGGSVQILPAYAPLCEQAARLREAIWRGADRVVLHVHPYSVVPTVALGVPGGPPVLLLNHLSQRFWVGGSVADLVLNLRDSAYEWSQAYRGITRNVILPIPVSPRAGTGAKPATNETRQGARRALGLPPEATVLLTVGNGYKYRPLPGLDFLDAASAILRACPQAYLLAVGPREDARWTAVRESAPRRLLAVGPQRDLAVFHAAADIYLEGFPVGSPTALLEVGLSGIPCIRAPRNVPSPFSADGVALAGVKQPTDVADYVRAAIALAESESERRAQGSALAAAIQANHTRACWPMHVRNAESVLPEKHRVYSLAGAAPLPTDLRDFSVALSTLGHSEGTLSFTLRAAFEMGLRAGVDALLAKALVNQCLFRDPRLLVRRRVLVALVGSVAGHRLMNGMRRARQWLAPRSTRSARPRP
jgi:hypothetical protein